MKNLTTHFTNITKGASKGRPILQGISYNAAEKTVSATDSHRMLYMKEMRVAATYVQNPLTLEILIGNYPDTKRLLSREGQNVTFDASDIDTKVINLLKAMKSEVIDIKVAEGKLSLHKENEGAFISIKVTSKIKQAETIAANAKYVLQALQFVKDAYNELTKEEVTFNYKSPVNPFTFRTTCYDYLITPVRRNN
jgi:DNA polymerase III sliding clamp (beta) subunit (PCNA family)